MSIAYDGGGDKNLLKLAAARVIACEKMPYLSTALFAMVPVKVEGLGTFASDDKWRLYWDPAKLEEWSVEETAGVLLHEVGHCIREHASRFQSLNEPHNRHMIFNVAGDSLINVDLRDERIPLPGNCVYVETIEGATREMSAEQIYQLIIKNAEKSCTCGTGSQGQSGDSNDNTQQNDSGSQGQESGQEEQESGSNSQGQSDDSTDNTQQNGTGGKGQPDPNCPVHGQCNCSPNGSGDPCGHEGTGIPQGWDCGSAADGVKRGYEQEGDKVDPGVDGDRADLIRQQVAVEITNHAKNRGTVPAGLARWAKDVLEPVVDWRRELSSIVRRAFASIAGLRDYSYQRPSRRQAAMRGTGQRVILPAMRQPAPPQVAIVVDTSGSMSDEMLTWAISETQGVLRSLGSTERSVTFYSCDAQAYAQKVRNITNIELKGGGGTDMRVGIEAAEKQYPKPDVIVCLTDGYTPWPDEPLKGTTLIVALTDEGAANQVPEWARKVTITR